MKVNKYHQSSVYRVEGIRLFHFIQQNVNHGSKILNASILTQFFSQIFNNTANSIVDFLHRIDHQGHEMNHQYWGYCISELLEDVPILTLTQINNIHYIIKSLIQGQNWKPLHRYQVWDQPQNLNKSQKQLLYQQILECCRNLTPHIKQKIPLATFEIIISEINCCFSLITLEPQKQSQIIEIYRNLLTINIIQLLQYALTIDIEQNKLLDEFLKMLCYLYSSYKYKQIKNQLDRTFLADINTKWGLMRNIEDKRPQVRYYTSVLAALISHHDKQFTKYIRSKTEYLNYICKNIGVLSEEDGILYAIEFLKNIIKSFAQASKEEVDRDIIKNIYNFALMVLQNTNSKYQTVAACLSLTGECVKVIDLTDNELKSLKIVTKVFDNNQNYALISGTLSIYLNVFLKEHQNTKELLLGAKQFDNYFKKCLNPGHEPNDLVVLVLQIILVMSYEENIKYLFEKNLIQPIISLTASANGTTMFYCSEIILNLVKNALDSEWMMTYLYEKHLLQAIGQLISQTQADDLMPNHYRIQGNFQPMNQRNLYFHKQVFYNCCKTLYFLTAEIDEMKYRQTDLKKRQLYRKNFTSTFIEGFDDGLKQYFILSEKFLKYDLKEECTMRISATEKYLKTYSLISFVIEQMTTNLRHYFIDLSILKKVNQLRNYFHQKLYALLTFNELEVEKIPIYIRYNIEAEGESVIRKRTTRLNWQEFNSFLNEIVDKKKGYETRYQILQNRMNRMISTEGDYRHIVDQIIHNYQESSFTLSLKLIQIRRVENREFSHTGSIKLTSEKNMMKGRQFPRFISTRMPRNRDASPFSRKGMSQSERSRSPNFGYLCTECKKNITTNTSKICQQCTQNNDFK